MPPPLSDLIAALESPLVLTVKLDAFVVPPPVVWIPPELSAVVVITESEILTTVPVPYENTPLPHWAELLIVAPVIVTLAPFVASKAALIP